MVDARIGRFLLLVAPLLFGLLAMHALVAPAGGDHGAAGGPAGHAAAVATSVGSAVERLPSAHAAPAAHVPSAVSAVPGVAVPDNVPGGHHSVDHLVHLCLAVLAAVGFAVAAAWVLLGAVLPSAVAPAGLRVRPAPAERPPPVPRRLARLCVMRN